MYYFLTHIDIQIYTLIVHLQFGDYVHMLYKLILVFSKLKSK